MVNRSFSCGLMLALFHPAGSAGEADVVAAVARNTGGGYEIRVTVRHEDQGWDHYADRWEILSAGGDVLATRVLHHPHVEEQPFARSLSGVTLPADPAGIRVRARDSLHGYGGAERPLEMKE